ATYEHKHVHTDVLVVGAGPAGLAGAREAGRTGARTLLLDDQPLPGGCLLSAGPATSATIDGRDDIDWIEATVAGFTEAEELNYVPNTTVFGSYDSNYFVALEDRTEAVVAAGGKGTRQRVWHIRAGQVVLATGAHDRPIVFANNDRPGIMLASAVRTYLGRFGVAAGENVAVATTNDSAYDLVADLHAAGVTVPAVIDSRTAASARAEGVTAARASRLIVGSAVTDTAGEGPAGRFSSITVAGLDSDGVAGSVGEDIGVDLLAVSGGHSPVIHLHGQ